MIAIRGAYDDQSNLLTAFRNLSVKGKVPKGEPAGHQDGWGILTYNGNSPIYAGRFPTNPADDPNYDHAIDEVRKIRPTIILAHFRKATIGAKSIANTQPYVNSKWGFGHNGTIWSSKINAKQKETDSEAYFRRVLAGLPRNSGRIEENLCATVKKIRNDVVLHPDSQRRTYSSLTCILSDGESIYALRDIPNEIDEDYYTLHYCALRDGVVICQEKLVERNWNSIPNRTLVAFHPGATETLSCE